MKRTSIKTHINSQAPNVRARAQSMFWKNMNPMKRERDGQSGSIRSSLTIKVANQSGEGSLKKKQI